MALMKLLTTILVAKWALLATAPAWSQVPLPPDAVLVSNSRVSVTYEDLLAELERLPEENRVQFLLNRQRLAKVVENILIGKIMSTEAQQSGLHKQPRVVAEIRNQTERVLAKHRREELDANAPKIDLTPLAREIFLTRLKDLERPAMYTSWHTLIKAKGRTLEQARERAKLVKAKVDGGEALNVIAKTYSDDESAPANAGFIEPTPLTHLDRGFALALEKLKVDESAIVETEYGVHVVRLIKVLPRHRPAFEDAKPAMIAEADIVYKQRLMEDYLTKIRNDPTLTINTDTIEKVRPKLPEIPPPPPAPAPTRPF
jgi:parvulin-like peptidyl-prolyl isomerase